MWSGLFWLKCAWTLQQASSIVSSASLNKHYQQKKKQSLSVGFLFRFVKIPQYSVRFDRKKTSLRFKPNLLLLHFPETFSYVWYCSSRFLWLFCKSKKNRLRTNAQICWLHRCKFSLLTLLCMLPRVLFTVPVAARTRGLKFPHSLAFVYIYGLFL